MHAFIHKTHFRFDQCKLFGPKLKWSVIKISSLLGSETYNAPLSFTMHSLLALLFELFSTSADQEQPLCWPSLQASCVEGSELPVFSWKRPQLACNELEYTDFQQSFIPSWDYNSSIQILIKPIIRGASVSSHGTLYHFSNCHSLQNMWLPAARFFIYLKTCLTWLWLPCHWRKKCCTWTSGRISCTPNCKQVYSTQDALTH